MRARRSLEHLYAEYGPRAKRLAYLLVGDEDAAQDLVQDAFARILGRFGNLRGPENFEAYLRTTIVNLARKRWKDRSRERALVEREKGVLLTTPERSGDRETKDEMWRSLMQLPARQRSALVLRYYEDLSEQQTARIMDCSVGAVKQLAARGMAALRELRAEEGTG